MKKILCSILLISLTFIFISCSTDSSPTGPSEITFSFTPTAGKTFTYQVWLLDSLNNKTGTSVTTSEKINAVNITYEGFSDVIQIITTTPEESDTSYMRVVSGKDIYQWIDTSSIAGLVSQAKDILYKKLHDGAWIPIVLLSKGNGVEYVTQPKKSTELPIDSVNSIPITIEVKVKNVGFENISVPAGTYKTYKVQTTYKTEIIISGIVYETINLIMNAWISDDLDYLVKLEVQSVSSAKLGMSMLGSVQELSSVSP